MKSLYLLSGFLQCIHLRLKIPSILSCQEEGKGLIGKWIFLEELLSVKMYIFASM